MARHSLLSHEQGERLARSIQDILAALAISLNELARRADIDQPTLWRASRGKLQKHTPKIQRLELYIAITLDRAHPQLTAVDRSVRNYLKGGGDITLLRSVIDALTVVRERSTPRQDENGSVDDHP